MKILVTGCAGFIGFHLTKRLLKEGHTVVGIDNLNAYYSPELKTARLKELGIDIEENSDNENLKEYHKGEFKFFRMDIEDKQAIESFLLGENFDAVCHLAAQAGVRYSITNPQEYISSNIQGFFNILEYCRSNPSARLVFASSSSIYGNNNEVPYKESDKTDKPASLYAATKKSNELMAYCYSSLYGIECIGLRFFTVYGPWGRPDMAPFLFTSAIMEDRPINVFCGGDMSRDFTYIDDIIEGVYRVLTKNPVTKTDNVNFRIYNIGNSQPVNLNDFIAAVEHAAGKKASRIEQPMQPGDVKITWADTSLLEKDYDYHPSTPLGKGLAEFIKWYIGFYNK